MSRSRHLATFLTTLLLLIALSIPAAGAVDPNTDGSTGATIDTGSALVQLAGAPLSTDEKTKPAPGKKIDFDSGTVKSYRAQLAALRNDFKKWLRTNAPKAKVTGEYDTALNAVALRLGGETLATIQSAPMVVRAEYQGLYYPTEAGVNDPDLALVHAVAAWGAGGAATAGAGVKVGVIDTGIDVTHPCFDDGTYPATPQLGDTRFTNNKVIVARVFNNKTPSRGYTAEAIQEHGTHVAGTIACGYGLTHSSTTVDAVSVPYGVTGVAPAAQLGNYNVFPGTVGNARSEDILNALEAAYADGMDIVNMSLGGGASGIQDLLTMAVDDLDAAGMLSAVAAGNEGPGHYTVSSPGSAARALTAGAYSVGHFIGSRVTVSTATYGAASGQFATVTTDLTAPLGVVTGGTQRTAGLNTACLGLPPGSLSAKIAVISRGDCTFSKKIRNAQSAGAVAALVVNQVAGDPVAMAADGTANQPTIPAYMVSLADRGGLMAADGVSATIHAGLEYLLTGNSRIMAGFSSQGPTDVDFRVKPDATAPGVNVLSSIPRSFCGGSGDCWAFFQGTSMATPHLAGIAAVVKGQHPTWSAAQVRSAIVNTATRGTLTSFDDGTTIVTDPNVVGAGAANAASAVGASVALDPVSVSFGSVPSMSGQTRTATISVTNLSGSFDGAVVTDTTGSGVTFSASVSGGTITVTMDAAKGAALGDHQATLRVMNGTTEVAHAVLYVFVKQ